MAAAAGDLPVEIRPDATNHAIQAIARGDLLAYKPWYDRHARYHGKDHPEYQTYSQTNEKHPPPQSPG